VKNAQIISIARFMPEKIVRNEPQNDLPDFFKPPLERRFAWPDYNAGDMGALALKNLFKQTGINPKELDLIICSASIQDFVNISVGPDIQYRSGATNARVLNMDTGCASYLSMLNTADAFIKAGQAKKIAIVTVTNFISRLGGFQKSHMSKVLGDGAAATLITAGKESSILGAQEESHGENYDLFRCRPQSESGQPQNYWEAGTGPLEVEFNPEQIERVKDNSIKLVVSVMQKSLSQAKLQNKDIDYLITHQPNKGLLKQWRDGIGINTPRAFDTFDSFGNLFQSTIPVTLSVLEEQNKLSKNKNILLGTFSNGGDFVSGMVLKWT